MGILKKAASLPGGVVKGVLGWRLLSGNHQYMKNMYRQIRNPSCPECEKGSLIKTEGEENLWLCSNEKCTFHINAATVAEASEIVQQIQKEKALAHVHSMDKAESNELQSGWRSMSRFYWTLSAVGILGSLYMVSSSGRLSIAFAWLVFAILFGIHALKSSYRHWQIETGTLFAEGKPFYTWLKNGKWFI